MANKKEADFLNTKVNFTPEECAFQIQKDSPERFFNRELSWLNFNFRVLEEADNPNNPLLERVRFLSISANNLDEFYTVRIAGLKRLLRTGMEYTSADGLTPSKQLELIYKSANTLMECQQDLFKSLLVDLAKEGILLIDIKDLNASDTLYLENYFHEQIFPVLTPLSIDPAHPFPFIPNKGFALALNLKCNQSEREIEALILIPSQFKKFLRLPSHDPSIQRFVRTESIILLFLDTLFPRCNCVSQTVFNILRDSDLEIEEEAEDLVLEFEIALKRRRRGRVINLKIESSTPPDLKQRIAEQLRVTDKEITEINGNINLHELSQLIIPEEKPHLIWPPYVPRYPARLKEYDNDIFAVIRYKDLVLHHPYETFETVVNFVRQAAKDPDVLAIKQTLYRTSAESPIVKALCEAAENGKSVTAIVELRARFDEAVNIRLARQLERAGVQIVYGFTNWKTHVKVATVIRREGASLVTYTHCGTGNYHSITAQIYTDLSLFTCEPDFGRDSSHLINFVTSYTEPRQLEAIAISPVNMKETILSLLEKEIIFAQEGKPAQVWCKMNALIDPSIIDALYKASQAGVKIDLIIRGICGLRPGITNLSENIRVKSIIGRFLEHSRIMCFGNGFGLPHPKALVYISSADWMPRNLERRVEAIFPIKNPTVHEQILCQIMAANLRDEAHSWVLDSNGKYIRFADTHGYQNFFSCHQFFMSCPSLSGRGSAQDGLNKKTRNMYKKNQYPDYSKKYDEENL